MRQAILKLINRIAACKSEENRSEEHTSLYLLQSIHLIQLSLGKACTVGLPEGSSRSQYLFPVLQHHKSFFCACTTNKIRFTFLNQHWVYPLYQRETHSKTFHALGK